MIFFKFVAASATVVPCLTTLISGFGGADQKGVVMGVFRSLGALARAFGPVLSSIGKLVYIVLECGDWMPGSLVLFLFIYFLFSNFHFENDRLNVYIWLFVVYWSCGDKVCYLSGAVLLLIPYIMLKKIKGSTHTT